MSSKCFQASSSDGRRSTSSLRGHLPSHCAAFTPSQQSRPQRSGSSEVGSSISQYIHGSEIDYGTEPTSTKLARSSTKHWGSGMSTKLYISRSSQGPPSLKQKSFIVTARLKMLRRCSKKRPSHEENSLATGRS